MIGERAGFNTWADPVIVNDGRIDHDDAQVRAAAERVHSNESLHRHNPAGTVCVYCALLASHAIAGFRSAAESDGNTEAPA